LSVWDMLGVDEKVMRAWLAGQNIDLDKLGQSVEARRQARLKFSADQFAITKPAPAEAEPVEQKAEPNPPVIEKPAAAPKARKTKPRRKA